MAADGDDDDFYSAANWAEFADPDAAVDPLTDPAGAAPSEPHRDDPPPALPAPTNLPETIPAALPRSERRRSRSQSLERRGPGREAGHRDYRSRRSPSPTDGHPPRGDDGRREAKRSRWGTAGEDRARERDDGGYRALAVPFLLR